VLAGGLDAWLSSGLPAVEVDLGVQPDVARGTLADRNVGSGSGVAHANAFLPSLVEHYVERSDLPLRRELTVLFVDIADSTPLIVEREPEAALALVQRFMEAVTEVALSFCGDVKDYEGDGAMLYFESVTEGVQAAFAIRERIAVQPADDVRLHARLSLDVGSLVIGIIGSPMRRSVALIGPSINRAARMLKEIPPDGIIATHAVVDRLNAETPRLAGRFAPLDAPLVLKGFEQEVVNAYSARD
jgi:class 3 adenylate cyclase